MALSPGRRLGPYEVLDLIGAGGMGEVYRARDPRIGREVAIKVLQAGGASDPDRLRRFEQEARAAGSLSHPGIVAIYDAGSEEGAPYVVTELLEGTTLRQRIAEAEGKLPLRKALDWAAQVALGLAAAHERGIVHRDLKPENVFVTKDGRAKILDFGLAKLAEPVASAPESSSGLTHSPTTPHLSPGTDGSEPGRVVGTIGYMSPEQVRGRAVDQRSDIFSLGCILYELLTGRRAFRGDTAADTMSAILREEPQELMLSRTGLGPALEQVVRHCLEKDPEERYQSARDLAFHLQALSVSSASGAVPPLDAAPRRAHIPHGGVALALLLLPAAGFFAARALERSQLPEYQPLTFRRGAVISARFAPDGESVVYAAAFDGRPFEVLSTRPGGFESRALGLARANLLAISSSGEMALSLEHRFRGGFQFSGTLARAPLAGGAPREVAEDVHEADWSPSSGELAVVRTVAGRDRLEFPIGNVLYETAGWISHARFSPDGRRLAFLHHPHWPDEAADVALVDLGGSHSTPSSGWSSAQGLVWSPSGHQLWFTAARTGKARALWAVAPDGRERLLTRAPGRLTLHDVAPDGRALVTRDSVRLEIAGRPPGAARERDLSWLDGSLGQDLSADGRTLLFSEGGEAGGAGHAAYVRGMEGSPAVRLADGLPTRLSPDGEWVLVLRRDQPSRPLLVPTGPGELRALPESGLEQVIWAYWLGDRSILLNGSEPQRGLRSFVMSPEAGPAQPVTPEGLWTAAVSEDGRRLAAVGSGRPIHLVELGADGEPQALPGSRPGDRPTRFSADGRALYVFRRDELPCRLERVDLATGRRETVRELLPLDPSGVVAVHEVLVTPDGSAYAYSYLRVLSELFLVSGL